MVDLAAVAAAARRIAPHAPPHAAPATPDRCRAESPGSRLRLKLENLQVTGSFKARGATNKVLTLPPAEVVSRGLVTASGGNHGSGRRLRRAARRARR